MATERELETSLNKEQALQEVHRFSVATRVTLQRRHHGLVVAMAHYGLPLPLTSPDCGGQQDGDELLECNGRGATFGVHW